MKSYLVDASVWLALAYTRHEHHSIVLRWFDQAGDHETHFCRITQLAFLRLLTNAKVMGRDLRTNREAWADYDEIANDPRVSFAEERASVDTILRALTNGSRASHRLWTDAYLGALSIACELRVVSFDRGFREMPGVDATILS